MKNTTIYVLILIAIVVIFCLYYRNHTVDNFSMCSDNSLGTKIYSGYFLVPSEAVNHCPAGDICNEMGVCPNSGYPCAIESFQCPPGYKFDSRGLTADGNHQLGNCIPGNWPKTYMY